MKRRHSGFTLLELTVVLLILVALAGVVLPFTQGTVGQAACQATDATLAAVKEAIMGSGAGPGYYSDMQNHYPAWQDGSGNLHYHLHFLFNTTTHVSSLGTVSLYPKNLTGFHPNLALGWRGPYLQNGGGKLPDPSEMSALGFDDDTGANAKVHFKHSQQPDDFYIFDQFPTRRPIVLQVPNGSLDCPGHSGGNDGEWCARLVSAGPDGVLQTQISDADASGRGDDRVLFLRIPNPYLPASPSERERRDANGNLKCAQ
ncbi:hypothetical protein JCM13664_08270 [Methylothermus subterraneus]